MSVMLKLGKMPNTDMAYTNKVFLNPADAPALGKFDKSQQWCKIKNVVFNFDFSDKVGKGEVALSNPQRTTADLALNDPVKLSLYSPSSSNIYLDSLTLTVGFAAAKKTNTHPYQASDLEGLVKQFLDKQYLNVGQQFSLEWDKNKLIFTVTAMTAVNLQQISGQTPGSDKAAQAGKDTNRGVIMALTQINITRAADSDLKLTGGSSSTQARTLFAPDFKFADMGIGGLDQEFGDIFRRAFASRIFPPAIVKKMGINHVRGILLYGPPGTGKTLMARQIGKMLNGREPKKVNGPEILSKFVGESEQNVRNLFADAEAEQKQRGDDSELHVIIFDEIDAICRQRGTRNDGTGVGDTVVNQLLSKIDGVDSLNNILLIGMTNRKDMIDEALLRPGRLEVHIEVSLPDEHGRVQILNIHTAKLRNNGFLGPDVDIETLAKHTKNFSGADIEGLVKAAVANATTRHIDVNNPTKPVNAEKITVAMQDFNLALEKDVKAAFGVAEDEFENTAPNGVLYYGQKFEKLIEQCKLRIEQVRNSARTPLVSMLLVGEPGSGKTAIAADLGLTSEFPFVKLISAETLVGWSEAGKIQKITKAFEDSYKSPLSIVIVDDLERLLEYAPIGPRFSNPILQTLMVFVNRPPPKGRRLLVIGTTTEPKLLSSLNFTALFSSVFKIPSVETKEEMAAVLQELDVFDAETAKQACAAFTGPPVPIKRLIMLIEMARQIKGDLLDNFQTVLTEESVRIRGDED